MGTLSLACCSSAIDGVVMVSYPLIDMYGPVDVCFLSDTPRINKVLRDLRRHFLSRGSQVYIITYLNIRPNTLNIYKLELV